MRARHVDHQLTGVERDVGQRGIHIGVGDEVDPLVALQQRVQGHRALRRGERHRRAQQVAHVLAAHGERLQPVGVQTHDVVIHIRRHPCTMMSSLSRRAPSRSRTTSSDAVSCSDSRDAVSGSSPESSTARQKKAQPGRIWLPWSDTSIPRE